MPVDDEQLYGISIVAWPIRDGEPDPHWKAGTDTLTNIRPGSLRERPHEEKQRLPDDMEAQEGQRTIAVHALENLALSDGGIVQLRRALKEAMAAMERGEDPPNTWRDEGPPHPVETHAWNTVIAQKSQEAE